MADLTDGEVLVDSVARRMIQLDSDCSISDSSANDRTCWVDARVDLAAVVQPFLAAAWEQGLLDSIDDPEDRERVRALRAEGDGAPNPYGQVWHG